MRLINADALIGSLHNYGFYDGNDREMVYRVIQLQPTIEPEPQWIPVTERLPEENGYYLVTRTSRFYNYVDIVKKSNVADNIASDITAWMPLPEPYREEGE